MTNSVTCAQLGETYENGLWRVSEPLARYMEALGLPVYVEAPKKGSSGTVFRNKQKDEHWATVKYFSDKSSLRSLHVRLQVQADVVHEDKELTMPTHVCVDSELAKKLFSLYGCVAKYPLFGGHWSYAEDYSCDWYLVEYKYLLFYLTSNMSDAESLKVAEVRDMDAMSVSSFATVIEDTTLFVHSIQASSRRPLRSSETTAEKFSAEQQKIISDMEVRKNADIYVSATHKKREPDKKRETDKLDYEELLAFLRAEPDRAFRVRIDGNTTAFARLAVPGNQVQLLRPGNTSWFTTGDFGHRYELVLESVLHVQVFLDISVPEVVLVDVLDSKTGTPLLVDLAIPVEESMTQTRHILRRVKEQLLHFADLFAVDQAVVMDQ